MAVKTRLPLFILLPSLLALFLVVALAKEDPEPKSERRREKQVCEDEMGWDVVEDYRREWLEECFRERCEARFARRREEEYRGWGEEEEEEFGGGSGRSYVFEKHEFMTMVDTEHGRVGVLPRFGRRSKVLQGINDFRLGFLDIDP